MVDSRAKGARAEAALVAQLKKDTGLNWKRVPGSGALHADHGLKGDVYVPNEHNLWAIEVKHYKDDQLTSKILTGKSPMLFQWWDQAVRQGEQTSKKPLLFFKFDRSKWFVMFTTEVYPYLKDFDHIILKSNLIVVQYETFIEQVIVEEWIK